MAGLGMDAFDYPLPAEAIAQAPVEPRDSARLLVALGSEGAEVAHRRVWDLPDLLAPGDLLVVNETRVLPARLRLRKESGGAVEVFLLEQREADGAGRAGGVWEALIRPSRKVPPGTVVYSEAGEPAAEALDVLDDGRRLVRLFVPPHAVGTVPLPPYITEPLSDPERYQTVYASERAASAAAPTAGLHLTPAVLERCAERGIGLARVELVVGLDTFRPVTAERPEDHVMHSEAYRVPPETWAAVTGCSGRVVAVGTTSVRALESAAATGALEGRTGLFIHGDYPFKAVDVLLTNFHMPKSSLLLLLSAFCGDRWRALYDIALAEDYRFLSFGDAMLVPRRP